MRKLALFLLLLSTAAAFGQASPGFIQGQILNADTPSTPGAQPGLNEAFEGKADFPIQNFSFSTAPLGTIKCQPTDSLVPIQDCTVPQVLSLLGLGQGMLNSCLVAIDFNAPNTDYQLPMPLALPTVHYRLDRVTVGNTTSPVTAASLSVWSGALATGTQIVANVTLGITTANTNTAGNTQDLTIIGATNTTFTFNPLFIRVGSAQGSGVTGDVCVYYRPVP